MGEGRILRVFSKKTVYQSSSLARHFLHGEISMRRFGFGFGFWRDPLYRELLYYRFQVLTLESDKSTIIIS